MGAWRWALLVSLGVHGLLGAVVLGGAAARPSPAPRAAASLAEVTVTRVALAARGAANGEVSKLAAAAGAARPPEGASPGREAERSRAAAAMQDVARRAEAPRRVDEAQLEAGAEHRDAAWAPERERALADLASARREEIVGAALAGARQQETSGEAPALASMPGRERPSSEEPARTPTMAPAARPASGEAPALELRPPAERERSSGEATAAAPGGARTSSAVVAPASTSGPPARGAGAGPGSDGAAGPDGAARGSLASSGGAAGACAGAVGGCDAPSAALASLVHARLAAAAARCYPPAARRYALAGTAHVSFCTRDDGVTQDARLRTSSGAPLLDGAATGCVVAAASPLPPEAASRCFTVPVHFGAR